MDLNAYAAGQRLLIFDALTAGSSPPVGQYDESVLNSARAKGRPQMGTTIYAPMSIHFEFIYPDSKSAATILSVVLEAPERIVMMPVPAWVIESIWQGEVSGSYHFESVANQLMKDFQVELSTEKNARWFGPQPAKRRE